jgi:hypothetical protein
MIDRTTDFGNPFPITKSFTREQSIEQFRNYFRARLASDPAFKKAVLALAGLTLGCWCKPKACHGDVYVEYLEGLDDDNAVS